MKKKATSPQLISEAIEPAIAEIAVKAQASTQAEAKPQTRKMVEFSILRSALVHATEKAQLIVVPGPDGTEFKVWLAKSLFFSIDDGDHPECLIFRMPAWVWYKKGLKPVFPEVRWSTEPIEQPSSDPQPAKAEEPMSLDASDPKQYVELKQKHPDSLLLFRCGDMYEIFGEDAKHASEVLGITLTKGKKRGQVIPQIAQFPLGDLDTNLPKLVRAGYKVAICEYQEEGKKKSKKSEKAA